MNKVALLPLLVVFAAAPLTARAESPKDEVHGEGTLADTSGTAATFSLSAFRTEDGFSGSVRYAQTSETRGTFTVEGRIACLTVLGNRTAVGVFIDTGTGTAAGKSGVVLFLEDNGGPGPHEVADRLAVGAFISEPGDPAACLLSDTDALNVALGDIVVVDGNALPAASE